MNCAAVFVVRHLVHILRGGVPEAGSSVSARVRQSSWSRRRAGCVVVGCRSEIGETDRTWRKARSVSENIKHPRPMFTWPSAKA
eukprot:4711192-Prymnesium_polylepis.4